MSHNLFSFCLWKLRQVNDANILGNYANILPTNLLTNLSISFIKMQHTGWLNKNTSCSHNSEPEIWSGFSGFVRHPTILLAYETIHGFKPIGACHPSTFYWNKVKVTTNLFIGWACSYSTLVGCCTWVLTNQSSNIWILCPF